VVIEKNRLAIVAEFKCVVYDSSQNVFSLCYTLSMKTVLYPHDERGKGEYGWLSTRYSFSFADWYDSTKMGFGALRVLNDDIIAPSQGFGTHGHKNMEIITIVTRGEVTHKDSMGNEHVLKAGEVQVMSAGTGVMHSEYNASPTEPLELFQLWVQPALQNIPPSYAQKSFDMYGTNNALVTLVHKDALSINQDASITHGSVDASTSLTYTLDDKEHGVYVFVITGEVSVGDEVLHKRDALGVTEVETLEIIGKENSKFLIIEVPMR
jgi:quercetin 2,3-dioxygenase